MKRFRHLFLLLVVVAIVVSTLGFSFQSAQAASCRYYHTVKRGQSLSSIGAWYGVSWKSIANANGIKSPWTIYSGQVLCIPSGGYSYNYNNNYTYVSYTPTWKNWTFSVIGVVEDASVTIKTAYFPDNMLYSAEIGCPSCGVAAVKVADVDSDKGGTFKKVFTIPAAFAGVSKLWVRLIQVNNGDDVQVSFQNVTSYGSGGQYYTVYDSSYKYYTYVPTISINSVVRNSSVTFTTHNYPANKTFEVFMGKMGTRGVNGYYVGSFNSGNGGSQTLTFSIPSALAGKYQIAIRAESTSGGFYSYNWFYNNTAY